MTQALYAHMNNKRKMKKKKSTSEKKKKKKKENLHLFIALFQAGISSDQFFI
jgi:hypothetical protein